MVGERKIRKKECMDCYILLITKKARVVEMEYFLFQKTAHLLYSITFYLKCFFSHSGSCTKFYIGEFLNKLNYPAYTNINGDLPLSAVT